MTDYDDKMAEAWSGEPAGEPPPKRRGRPPGSRDRGPRVAGGAKAAARREREASVIADEPIAPIAEVVADERDAKRRKEKSFLRAPHGRAVTHGTPGPRVEVPPADELSTLPAARILPVDARAPGGRFVAGNATAALGGRARARQVAYATRLGLRPEFVEQAPEDFRRHMAHAASYRQARIGELALTVGQEGIGPGVKVRIGQAALELGASKYLFERAVAMMDRDSKLALALFSEARKMDDSSRQNELAGHELAVREAKARAGGAPPPDPLGAYRARPALEPAGEDPNSADAAIRVDGEPSEAVIEETDRRG